MYRGLAGWHFSMGRPARTIVSCPWRVRSNILRANTIKSTGTMFDRFTEDAKRVVFYARYEAAQAGSPAIESEHLLLGILRDGRGPAQRILARHGVTRERVEHVMESRSQASHPASSGEIPLSAESKRVLTRAASESGKRLDPGIDTEHILLGILYQEVPGGCHAERTRGARRRGG